MKSQFWIHLELLTSKIAAQLNMKKNVQYPSTLGCVRADKVDFKGRQRKNLANITDNHPCCSWEWTFTYDSKNLIARGPSIGLLLNLKTIQTMASISCSQFRVSPHSTNAKTRAMFRIRAMSPWIRSSNSSDDHRELYAVISTHGVHHWMSNVTGSPGVSKETFILDRITVLKGWNGMQRNISHGMRSARRLEAWNDGLREPGSIKAMPCPGSILWFSNGSSIPLGLWQWAPDTHRLVAHRWSCSR